MTSKEYQNKIHVLIKDKFPKLDVNNEWIAFKREINHYSPRVDIAVGPFSIESGRNKRSEFNGLLNEKEIKVFLASLYKLHLKNLKSEVNPQFRIPELEQLIYKNHNARCFLAIEIENKNSKKHVMGSIINAASLGRIGIGIAFSNKTLKTFIRILYYLDFLKRVEKNTYDTTNFLVVTKEQMKKLLAK